MRVGARALAGLGLALASAWACATPPAPEPEPAPVEPEPVFLEQNPAPPAAAKTAGDERTEQRRTEDRAEAKLLFELGMRRYRQGDYAGAEVKFVEAYALEPLPPLKFNIARCQMQRGDTPAACATLAELLAHPELDDGTRQLAEDQRSKLGC